MDLSSHVLRALLYGRNHYSETFVVGDVDTRLRRGPVRTVNVSPKVFHVETFRGTSGGPLHLLRPLCTDPVVR